MPVFDDFPAAAFGGIKIPISRISMRGGIRKHTHEFPHSPGGEQEKLGRKLYTVRMTAHFHDLPGTDFAARFPNCYPGSLLELRRMFEAQATDDLVIPSVGTIKAFALDWEQVADFGNATSGEEVSLEFEEDQEAAFLTGTMFEFGADALSSRAATLSAKAALADYFGQPKPSIFDQINDAVTAAQGVIDQGDAYARLAAGKLEYVASLCALADRDVQAVQHPKNFVLLDALKDVWASASALSRTLSGQTDQIATFTVPRKMAIGAVSTAIYDDASHAVDLLNLNPIEDAFAIPAGTSIRYLVAA